MLALTGEHYYMVGCIHIKGVSQQSCALTETVMCPGQIQNAMVCGLSPPRAQEHLRDNRREGPMSPCHGAHFVHAQSARCGPRCDMCAE